MEGTRLSPRWSKRVNNTSNCCFNKINACWKPVQFPRTNTSNSSETLSPRAGFRQNLNSKSILTLRIVTSSSKLSSRRFWSNFKRKGSLRKRGLRKKDKNRREMGSNIGKDRIRIPRVTKRTNAGTNSNSSSSIRAVTTTSSWTIEANSSSKEHIIKIVIRCSIFHNILAIKTNSIGFNSSPTSNITTSHNFSNSTKINFNNNNSNSSTITTKIKECSQSKIKIIKTITVSKVKFTRKRKR